MPITREDVIACYQALLGRHPESEAAIQYHAHNSHNISDILFRMVQSEEYQNRHNGIVPTGRFLDVVNDGINIQATAEQMNEMFQHIGASWRDLGQKAAHWSVLTDQKFMPDTLGQNLEEFYQTGREWAQIVRATLLRNDINLSEIKDVMDFGCGVGRMTFGLADLFENIVGVDISQKHLNYAIERSASLGYKKVKFIEIASIEEISNLPNIDFLFSVIVLQHNPPPVMAEILKNLLMKVNPGGFAMFQIPTFWKGYSFNANYYLSNLKNSMEMHVLPQREIFRLIADNGFRTLEVREDTYTGIRDGVSQTFLLHRP